MSMENPLKNLLETEEEIEAKQKELDSKFREGSLSNDELGKIEEERDLLKKDRVYDEAYAVNFLSKNQEDADVAIGIVEDELIKDKQNKNRTHDEALLVNSLIKNKEDVDTAIEIVDEELSKKKQETKNNPIENKGEKGNEVQNEIKPVEKLKGLKLKKQLDNLEKDKEKHKRIKKTEQDEAFIKDLAKDKKDIPTAVELLKERERKIEKRNKERYGIDDSLLKATVKGFGNALGSAFGARTVWEWNKLRSDIHNKKELKKSTAELLNVDVSEKIVKKLSSFNEKLKKVSLPEVQKKELRSRMAKVLSEHRHSKEKLDKEKLQKIDRVFDVYINNSAEAMVVAREAVNTASIFAMMPWLRGVGYVAFAGASGLAKISNEYDRKYFDNAEKIDTTGKVLSMAKTITVDSVAKIYNGLVGNFYKKDENGQKMGIKRALGGFVSTLVSVGTFAMRVGAVAEFEHMLASGNLLAKEGSEKLLDALKEGKIGQAFAQGGKNWLNNADRLLSYFGVHIGNGDKVVDTVKSSIENIKDDPKFFGVIKQGGDVDHTANAIGKAAGISNAEVVKALKNTFVKDINGNLIPLSKTELVQPGVGLRLVQGENGKSFFEVLLPKGGGGFASKEVYHDIIKDNGERLSRSVNSFGQDKINFNDIHKDNISLNGKLDLDHNDIFTKNNENVSNIIYKDGNFINTRNPEILNGKLDLHNDIQASNKIDTVKDVVKNNVHVDNEVDISRDNFIEKLKYSPIKNEEVKFVDDYYIEKNFKAGDSFNIENIKFNGTVYRFEINDKNEIAACHFKSFQDKNALTEKLNYFNDNWKDILDKLPSSTNKAMANTVIDNGLSEIYVYKNLINKLVSEDKGKSDYVEFLKRAIDKNIEYIEKTYGDVFKDSDKILKINTK